MDQKQRFMGWRKRMPEKAQYLIDQVLERLVPEFEKQGFVWYPDFAENNPQEIGANEIPLQRRVGEEWPTVQIKFIPKGPKFQICFAALPKICRSPVDSNIPRDKAVVVYAPAYFYLCKTPKRRTFGYSFIQPGFLDFISFFRYQINWRKLLDSEVDSAIEASKYLFKIFEEKKYSKWISLPFGVVNDNVFLLMSWKIRDDLERSHKAKSA